MAFTVDRESFRRLRYPGYYRSRLYKRLASAFFLLLAALTVVMPLRDDSRVVVVRRPVAAGEEVSRDDVALLPRSRSTQPAGSHTSVDDVAGRIALSRLSPNEIVTSARLLDEHAASRIADGSGSPIRNATMVPITLADPHTVSLLHHGDTVTILTARDDGAPEVIASNAKVLLAGSTQQKSPFKSGQDSTVLVVLPEDQAATTAVAALSTPLTVVVTGARARPRDS